MSHTLLLADDSPTTRRVVELTFADHDIRVVAVTDGQDALDRLQRQRPDIILAQASLPRVDGYRLAAHVRSDPTLAGVPVVLLTGAFDAVDEQRVRESGAAGVITKPFEPELVIKRVKELLGLSDNTDRPEAPAAGRLITSAEPPPQQPPAGPRGVGPPPPRPATPPRAPVMPPRAAHIPLPSAAWDELRQQTGLSPDTAHIEGQQPASDDYFDRLDAAFDHLDKQLSGRGNPGREVPSVRSRPPMPPPRPEPELPRESPVFEVDQTWFDDHTEMPQAAPPAASAVARPEPSASHGETSPKRSIDREGGPVALGAPVADAFDALLAAEQGIAAPPPSAEPIVISDEVIERIAERVAERLTEGVFMDTVTHIVTAVAERLVREEIARIRAKAEAQKR